MIVVESPIHYWRARHKIPKCVCFEREGIGVGNVRYRRGGVTKQ